MKSVLHAGHWKSLKTSMDTGAVFEPKALCGSTLERLSVDCGTGGREAAFARTTGEGITGGSEGEEAFVFSAGAGADCCAICEAGEGALCNEGRNSAPRTSKPTLMIPAKMRRRFTRSSEMVDAKMPCTEQENSTSKSQESERSDC